MNKLWDDLKDNMKEWGVSAVEKAEEISRVAVAKGEEFTKISKLKFEILQLQKDKNKVYEKLGLLVYNKTNESNVSNFTGDVEYFSLIEKINKYSIEISEKDEVSISKINLYNYKFLGESRSGHVLYSSYCWKA